MNRAAQKGKRVAEASSGGLLRPNQNAQSKPAAKAINIEVVEDENEANTLKSRHNQARNSYSNESPNDQQDKNRRVRQADSRVIDERSLEGNHAQTPRNGVKKLGAEVKDRSKVVEIVKAPGIEVQNSKMKQYGREGEYQNKSKPSSGAFEDAIEFQEQSNQNQKELQEKIVVHQKQNLNRAHGIAEVREDVGSDVQTQTQRRTLCPPSDNSHDVLVRSNPRRKGTAVASGDEYEEDNAEEELEEDEEEEGEKKEEAATKRNTRPQMREKKKANNEGYENDDTPETKGQPQGRLTTTRSNKTEAGEIEEERGGRSGGEQLPQRIKQGRKWRERENEEEDANFEEDESKPSPPFTGRSTLRE